MRQTDTHACSKKGQRQTASQEWVTTASIWGAELSFPAFIKHCHLPFLQWGRILPNLYLRVGSTWKREKRPVPLYHLSDPLPLKNFLLTLFLYNDLLY